MSKRKLYGPSNRPVSAGQVKAFIKRASASQIDEYLDFIHQAGYRFGVRDAVSMIKAQSEEAQNDAEGLPSTQEPVDDGEVSVD